WTRPCWPPSSPWLAGRTLSPQSRPEASSRRCSTRDPVTRMGRPHDRDPVRPRHPPRPRAGPARRRAPGHHRGDPAGGEPGHRRGVHRRPRGRPRARPPGPGGGRGASELAGIVVPEQGKPIGEARGEVQGAKAFLDVALANKYRDVGELVAPNTAGEQLAIREEPYGVVAAIIPWHFPAAIFARQVGAPLIPRAALLARQARRALLAGNRVGVKPSEVTPLSALAMARVCQLAGLPDGLVNVVGGDGRAGGRQVVGHPG